MDRFSKTHSTNIFVRKKMLVGGLLLLASFTVLLLVRIYVNHFTSGDEPHYLIMNYSLKFDNDLDLKNNYTNADYFRYYPEYIFPHVSHLNMEKPNSGWYSFHGVGLPLLLHPAFLIAERVGPMLFMILIATVVLFLTYKWTFIVSRSKRGALMASFILLMCYFFNGLAGYLYPDLIVAVFALVSFIILSTKLRDRLWFQAVLGLSLGLMVFMHFRTIVLAIALAAYFFYLRWKGKDKTVPWLFLATSGVLALLFLFFLHRWFGVWFPNEIYTSKIGVSPKNLINTPAILFDSLRGVLTYNPILFLIPVGLPIWFKTSAKNARILLTLLPLAYVTFGFNEWHGGFAPTGRYLVVFFPLLVPAVIFFYLNLQTYTRKIMFYFLLTATATISLTATVVKQPFIGYSLRTEIFTTLQSLFLIPIDKFFPRYNFIDNTITDKYGVIQAIFWMLVVCGLVIYGFYIAKRRKLAIGRS